MRRMSVLTQSSGRLAANRTPALTSCAWILSLTSIWAVSSEKGLLGEVVSCRRRQAEGRKQARTQRRGIEDDFADLFATCQDMQGMRQIWSVVAAGVDSRRPLPVGDDGHGAEAVIARPDAGHEARHLVAAGECAAPRRHRQDDVPVQEADQRI